MITLERTKEMYEHVFGCKFDDDRGLFLECLYTTCYELRKPAIVLEVGTYLAKSTFAMACGLHGTGSRIICVDPIFIRDQIVCTDAHHPWSEYGSSVREVLCRLAMYDLAHMVSIVPGFSEWVYQKWSDGPIFDLLLVDGAHTYNQVSLDLRWSTHMKPSATILLDDWIVETKAAALDYFVDKPEWNLIHESTAERTPRWCITAYQRKA